MTPGTILLVEDDADDEFLTLRALGKNGIRNPVEVVRDGEQAVEWLSATGRFAGRDRGHAPILVLLDLNLPKLSGFEVLQRIRSDAVSKMIPVVVLTTSADEPDVKAAYTRGANGYVVKPVSFDDFVSVVGRIGLFWLLTNRVVAPDGVSP